MLCLDDKILGTGLYYWDRAEVRATAEVDYLFANNGIVFPIEVKSGAAGHLKSMYRFLSEHPGSPFGIRISERAYSKQDKVVNVPVYAAATISYVIESFLRE
ncbi:MAG: hypothetical protein JNL74_22895 [Fibrobacteres bacterium]|nr:hypothetical protein [Fibrobacterota bacterium]